jgi:hypothetical protein
MNKIREIFATVANKMAHNARDEEFQIYKKQLMERVNTAANEGEFCLHVNTFSAKGHWGELKSWLESLGFTVGWNAGNIMAVVKWDDDSIAKQTMATNPARADSIKFGWHYDTTRYDFVCSCCHEHSEYTSDYCPHCGAKTFVPDGSKRRDY